MTLRPSAGPDQGAREHSSVEVAWRTEPSRIDLACALYDRLMEQQRGIEATALLREVVKRLPHSLIANFLMGEHLLDMNQPSSAAHYFQRSADAQPANADDWLYKSLSLIRLNQRKNRSLEIRKRDLSLKSENEIPQSDQPLPSSRHVSLRASIDRVGRGKKFTGYGFHVRRSGEDRIAGCMPDDSNASHFFRHPNIG